MKTIVVDDDQLSRKVVEEFVNRTESLTLVNSYSNAVDAINDLQNKKIDIDLIFLDVEMPEMTGIEFLKSLHSNPHVIIISAKEKYALEAFEYDVTDYILKPISYSRFFKAVSKVIKRSQTQTENSSFSENSDEIFIKKNSVFVRLSYNDILYVEALENYVIVNTYDEKYTIHFTMKAILNKLPMHKFKRVHRSFIVNINTIKGIEDNNVIIEMHEGKKLIPIGKSYKDKLMSDINLMTK
ncbi:MAG: response regulator transcription factor [Bacteroidales bacterium]|nr:response regulator transcription factor [Bacteroidales bacterium]